MHWRKRWQRGFNQAELLAREISSRTSGKVIAAVRRVKATRPQAGTYQHRTPRQRFWSLSCPPPSAPFATATFS